MGHRVFMSDVGARCWDLHCLDCEWQDWTWAGQGSAEEIADRHAEAMKLVGRTSLARASSSEWPRGTTNV